MRSSQFWYDTESSLTTQYVDVHILKALRLGIGRVRYGKASHEENKRLSMKRLPPVLSVQFKVNGLPEFTKICFDAYGTALRAARNGRVQDRHSRPSSLLSTWPCTQQRPSRVAARKSPLRLPLDGADSPPHVSRHLLYDYELFAVINHEG